MAIFVFVVTVLAGDVVRMVADVLARLRTDYIGRNAESLAVAQDGDVRRRETCIEQDQDAVENE